MTKDTFAAQANSPERILNAIRAPEQEFLTPYYVAHKSKEVADSLLQLVQAGEADSVTSFISSDGTRFETLAKNGQLKTLVRVVSSLDNAHRFQVISASESYLYGHPNATVLQNFVGSRDAETTGKLAEILRGFDNAQRTELFKVPGAVWWMSSYDQVPLLYEILYPLSKEQRQEIYASSRMVPMAITESCCPELSDLFKGCVPAAAKTSELKAKP
jgi:hypothetical protein